MTSHEPPSAPTTPWMSTQFDEGVDYPLVADFDEGVMEEENITRFRPPYPLDSAHSYYNDGESSYKLAADIITPADEKFLGGLGIEGWRAQLLEFTTKVVIFVWFSIPGSRF